MYKNCVFIIESPNKIAKIKELTGSSFVFATGGHFVELVNIEVIDILPIAKARGF
ncbi:type IA DNA topoisomerase [Helicobacter pylori]|nr:type IA DNA topoisomerase [Helicobacter pylori]